MKARIRPDAGWIDDGKRRATCRCGCGEAIPQGRRTFASDECVHGWKLQTQPAYVRQKVWERDHGVCAVCGVDTEQQEREALAAWRAREPRHWWDSPPVSSWAADHIVPVAEGGGGCGLEGYRTLCRECHACETAALRARLRAKRRAPKGRE